MSSTSARLYWWLGLSTPFDDEHKFVTSALLSPMALACIRLTLALYSLVTIITVLAYDSAVEHDADSFFSYFTELSYIGLTSYLWASGVQTFAYVLRGQKNYPLQTWPRILQLLHIVLFSTITTFPLITTIVFWSLLASKSTFETIFNAWSDVSMHALNSAFVLFEIFCTRMGPSPWTHLIVLIPLLACYLGVAYITYATQGFYTYSFLDPTTEHGLLAAYIVGITIGECVLFAGVRGMCWLRQRAIGRREVAGSREEIDEWQEIDAPKEASLSDV